MRRHTQGSACWKKCLFINLAIISELHLERLDKGVEENSDADTSAKQFDESRRPKQFEKTDLDQLGYIDDASHHCDEVKDVPRLAEIVLKENSITLPHH